MIEKHLKKEIENIKERNKRVELDKAWETSWFRKISISIMTYFVFVLFFYFAGLQKPFVNSIIPAFAFVLSTLSLPVLKKFWLNNFNRK